MPIDGFAERGVQKEWFVSIIRTLRRIVPCTLSEALMLSTVGESFLTFAF